MPRRPHRLGPAAGGKGLAAAIGVLLCVGTATASAGGFGAFPYKDGPKSVPDGHGKATMKADIPLIGSSTNVLDVEVNVRIRHPRTSDLVISARSPSGDAVTVSKRSTNGRHLGSGGCPEKPLPMFPAFPDWTTFDDEAADPPPPGDAPYLDSYTPEEPLSAFDGSPADGEWKLTVKDVRDGRKGAILCGMLKIEANYNL